jgi:hypothetical protein
MRKLKREIGYAFLPSGASMMASQLIPSSLTAQESVTDD